MVREEACNAVLVVAEPRAMSFGEGLVHLQIQRARPNTQRND
jgi:hypothetical protein